MFALLLWEEKEGKEEKDEMLGFVQEWRGDGKEWILLNKMKEYIGKINNNWYY